MVVSCTDTDGIRYMASEWNNELWIVLEIHRNDGFEPWFEVYRPSVFREKIRTMNSTECRQKFTEFVDMIEALELL